MNKELTTASTMMELLQAEIKYKNQPIKLKYIKLLIEKKIEVLDKLTKNLGLG